MNRNKHSILWYCWG